MYAFHQTTASSRNAPRAESYLQYPDTDDEGSPPVTRPELRLLTDGAMGYTSDATESPPNSSVTASPMIDTPLDITSPGSSTSSNSPLMAATDASAMMPRMRAHSLQPPRLAVYPPPALPQLLQDPALGLFNASQEAPAVANAAEAAPERQSGKSGRRTSRLAKSASLPSYSPGPSGDPAAASSSTRLSHPYARIYAKKAATPSVKRRKMWNHALEKNLFTPEEIASLSAPNRRAIYTASLEHHIDKLHAQLLEVGLYPIPLEALGPYRGLNSKTAKSMVAGLHKDSCDLRTKLMELERATQTLYRNSQKESQDATSGSGDSSSLHRRHSVAAASYVYPNIFIDATASKLRTTIS